VIRPARLHSLWWQRELTDAGYDRPRASVGQRADVPRRLRPPSWAPGPRDARHVADSALRTRKVLAYGQWLRSDEGAHTCQPLTTTGRTPA
jgi:hypothetical protein